MMHMTFYWGVEVTLLFDGWRTRTPLQYWASLLVLAVASVFHEYVVSVRAHLRQYTTEGKQAEDEIVMGSRERLVRQFKKRACTVKAAESMLFAVNALLGYLLMLAAMSFNGGVVVAIVVGLTTGFLCFRSGNYVAQEEELRLSSDPCSSCT
uniref:Copper transport protein n=1 Tax=Araucaria cunninghamii TaxID=56994 RepID=A0A0D6QT51_ARACU